MIPAQAVIELNPPVLRFTLCVAILTTLIFGLVPALQGARRDVNEPLRDSGKGVSGGFRGRWLPDALVVMEVALSLTLLIGAGLLTRSFVTLRQAHLGLQAERVFQTSLILPPTPYLTKEQVPRFFQTLLARVKALPGVLDAAASSTLPPYSGDQSKVEIAGKVLGEDSLTLFQHVSLGYFRVLQIEFTGGRPFSEAEIDRARNVAVVARPVSAQPRARIQTPPLTSV